MSLTVRQSTESGTMSCPRMELRGSTYSFWTYNCFGANFYPVNYVELKEMGWKGTCYCASYWEWETQDKKLAKRVDRRLKIHQEKHMHILRDADAEIAATGQLRDNHKAEFNRLKKRAMN